MILVQGAAASHPLKVYDKQVLCLPLSSKKVILFGPSQSYTTAEANASRLHRCALGEDFCFRMSGKGRVTQREAACFPEALLC